MAEDASAGMVRAAGIQPAAVVVIGRNEGPNLARAIQSARVSSPVVVYVDSGSTDRSPDIARECGVSVVELDGSARHTAARGRNAGFHWVREHYPEIDYVQFLDGDCELRAQWLTFATDYLLSHADVGVVTGLLRERDAHRNAYHRLADMEWKLPIGEVTGTGGMVLVRTAVWAAVGGMAADMKAGEEPDFCRRVRAAGWRIVHVAEDMAWHDIGITRFAQWWTRATRAGSACAARVLRGGIREEPRQVRELASLVLWGLALPTAALAFAQPTAGASLCLFVSYCWLWVRVRRSRIERGDAPADARLYASFCVLSKYAGVVGAIRFVTRNSLALRR